MVNNLEICSLEDDLQLLCIQASSFPDGILAAYEALHNTLPDARGSRVIYGISYPDKRGNIVYKAAAEAVSDDEASQTGLEPFLAPKGRYLSVMIYNYMENVSQIGVVFQQLITDPRIDPTGVCLEMYIGADDVRCMVRLSDTTEG
jgi:predicted transcriptional regulator YdeE